MNRLTLESGRETIPEGVYGTIFRFLPSESIKQVLTSSKIPQIGLKYLNIRPKYRSLSIFDEEDIEFLSKNTFIDPKCLLFLYLRYDKLVKAKRLLERISTRLANTIFSNEETTTGAREMVLDYVDPSVALTVSIRLGLDVVKVVIEHFGSSVLFSNGKTILNACKWNKPTITSYLVSVYTKEHQLIPFECLKTSVDGCRSDILEILIREGQVDPSARGNYCMHTACEKGYHQIVEVLLRTGLFDSLDLRKRMIGFGIKSIEVVKLLLTYPIKDSQIVVDDGVLANAIGNGPTKVVELLIGWKHLKINNYQRVVSFAASSPNFTTLKTLLEDSRFYPGAVTSLKSAIVNNRLGNVMILLKDKRVDPTFSPGLLTKACEYWRILEWLLNDGRLHPGYSNYQVFRKAATIWGGKSMSVLLEDTRTNKYGIFFALLEAIKHQNVGMVKLILKDLRCDPSMQKNEALTTSLRVQYHSLKIARLLLAHSKVRPTYYTLFHFIGKNDHLMIKELIDKYPVVCCKLRPFGIAYSIGKSKMLKILWETDVIRKSMSGRRMRSLLNRSKGEKREYLQTLLPEIEKMERAEGIVRLKLVVPWKYTYLFWNKFRTYLKENNITVDSKTASSLYKVYQNSKNKSWTLVEIVKQGKLILE